MIRFALSPDAVVTPDLTAKLPGRGAWVMGRRSLVEDAVKRGAFSRAFRQSAAAPGDIADAVEAGLERAALSALGLARRAGAVTTGFEKVRAGARAGTFPVLIAAADGAADGRKKIEALIGDAVLVDHFDRVSLSDAIGAEMVHAGLKRGPATERFLRAAQRLTAYRGDDAAKGKE